MACNANIFQMYLVHNCKADRQQLSAGIPLGDKGQCQNISYYAVLILVRIVGMVILILCVCLLVLLFLLLCAMGLSVICPGNITLFFSSNIFYLKKKTTHK